MNPIELNNSDLDISTHHISNVSNNTLNLSHNRLSSLSISYISYFYHVFPLHLNSFNSLFSDVISPKLSILISSVDQFICLTSDIDSFICSLKSVSSYLNNNPAQSLINIINKFNAQSYVDGVKNHTNGMIDQLEGKIKYEQIIGHVKSTESWIVSQFNSRLKKLYEAFKNKITGHKESLKEKIQEYIGKIKGDLTQLSSCVKELIDSICDNINKLSKNQGKLSDFTYGNIEDLVKNSSIEIPGYPHFEKIFEIHEKYKKCLNKCVLELTFELGKFMCELNCYKICIETLTSKLNAFISDIANTTNIDDVVESLESLKSKHLDKLNGYMESVQKLEKIGKYIKTMKNSLTQLTKIESKVDDKAANYINELEEIDIKSDEVKRTIEKIKCMNELVIAKLKVAKSASGFYNSLEQELIKLNQYGVTFSGYGIPEFKNNSSQIKEKLTTFEENIKSKLDNTNQEIKKSEEKIKELEAKCPGTQEQANGNEDELSSNKLEKIKNDYTSEIPNIKNFIEESLEVIKIIKYILLQLENNKNYSSKLSEIKSQVSSISGLSDAITKLPQVKNELNNFVKLQQHAKVLIDNSTSYTMLIPLKMHSEKLQDSITKSSELIGYVLLSIEYLKIIECINSVTKWIKRFYEYRFQRIRQIIDNFKGYIIEITSKLEDIKCDLCQLKSTISTCCTGYNNPGSGNYDLGKLKDYIKILKTYIPDIKTNFITIKTTMNKIKQESTYIDQNKCELENLKCAIHCYIQNTASQGFKQLVENYLDPIKNGIDEVLKVKRLLTNFSSLYISEIIQCKLQKVEQSVNQLECAIEGVVRNTIRCSLKSLSKHLKTNNRYQTGLTKNDPVILNYSLLNVTNYNVVIDRLYEIWSFSDEAIELFNFIWLCKCDQAFRSKYRAERPSAFPESLYRIKTRDINPVSELTRNTMAENVGNHLCLCLVIKYHLRPSMLKCILYLRNEDLGALSTISRKYQKYNPMVRLNLELWKLYCLSLSIIYRIVYWIKHKYNFVWVGYYRQPEIKCFCTIKNTVEYHYLISLILYLSSLIENIWSANSNSVLTAINHLSSLLSEYQCIHVYTNYYSARLNKILRTSNNGNGQVSGSISAQVVNDDKTLISSNITSTTKITETKDNSAKTRIYGISTITTGLGILNNSITAGLMSLKKMILATDFSKDKFRLIYGKYSEMMYSIENSGVVTEERMRIRNKMGMEIPLKYLNEICKPGPEQCNCTVTNKECKICPKARIGISCLSISLNQIELIIFNVSGDMLLNYLMLFRNKSINFITNLCVGFTEVYTAMTKNNYSNFNAYRDHKNIANIFPCLTVGYGYENVYRQI